MKGPAGLCEKIHPDRSPVTERPVDFSEYMWMEEMEEFDRKVEEELLEQEFIEACFEQMLAEEAAQQEWYNMPQCQQDQPDLISQVQQLHLTTDQSQSIMPVLSSTLNPNAPEFVPRGKVAER